MKLIPLTRGLFAKIDDSDYVRLMKHKWQASSDTRKHIYARGIVNGKHIYMHRFILRLTDSVMDVDHKDGNGLNNQRSNIRICNRSSNLQNRKISRGKSKYMGVSLQIGKWRSSLYVDKKRIYLRLFNSEINAAKAYDRAAIKYHKEFANLNFPQKPQKP